MKTQDRSVVFLRRGLCFYPQRRNRVFFNSLLVLALRNNQIYPVMKNRGVTGFGQSISIAGQVEIQVAHPLDCVAGVHGRQGHHMAADLPGGNNGVDHVGRIAGTGDGDKHVTGLHPAAQGFGKDFIVADVVGNRRNQCQIREDLGTDMSVLDRKSVV